jgi:hypothetical protein
MTARTTMTSPLGDLVLVGEETADGVTLTSLSMPGVGPPGLPRERIRALGAAIGANPVLLVRPCHRVIGADGSMRGYAAGVERKVRLLTHEGALQPTLL